MSTRKVSTGAWVVLGGLLASCSSPHNSLTAPTNTVTDDRMSPTTLSTSTLQITSMGVSDAGQSAAGQWFYEARAYLHAGGVDVTVTRIRVQLLLNSQVLSTASISPLLSVPMNSSRDAALMLASNAQVSVSALAATVTVDFRDAKGNTGSVSETFSCFGCWDY